MVEKIRRLIGTYILRIYFMIMVSKVTDEKIKSSHFDRETKVYGSGHPNLKLNLLLDYQVSWAFGTRFWLRIDQWARRVVLCKPCLEDTVADGLLSVDIARLCHGIESGPDCTQAPHCNFVRRPKHLQSQLVILDTNS